MELAYSLPRGLFYMTVFAISSVLALFLTPLAKRLALRLDIVDRPGGRKIHSAVVPYLGGLAIYLAFWLALGLSMAAHLKQLTAIVVGGTLVMLLGLWDDRFGMHPVKKMAGQSMAAVIVLSAGIQFHLADSPFVNLAVSLVWIVGLTNAMNLLDNMDGLSGGSTLISSSFVFLVAAYNGQFLVAAMALSLMGACLGFLRYNFAPASIFMGDAGSLFLGFITSVMSLKLRPAAGAEILNILVPATLLGLPILDTTLVMIQRVLHSRPWYLGGRDHCSHRLVIAGCSRTLAVLILYVVTMVFGVLAILLNVLGPRPYLGATIGVYAMALFTLFSAIPAYHKEIGELTLDQARGGFPTGPER